GRRSVIRRSTLRWEEECAGAEALNVGPSLGRRSLPAALSFFYPILRELCTAILTWKACELCMAWRWRAFRLSFDPRGIIWTSDKPPSLAGSEWKWWTSCIAAGWGGIWTAG